MFKLGIIGTGWIAEKMAATLSPLEGYCVYAIASRCKENADRFASNWNIGKAYDSYDKLVEDKDIDLVYIATPHSHHFEHTMLAINAGKHVLVEKAFTANSRQAEELISAARNKGVFITEAIWTRYMPLSAKINELINRGLIGKPRVLTATLCYMMENKERILKPELCGGALLDLGVYTLNFARMYFGSDIVKSVSNCILGPTGVDMQESISLTYADGKMANLQSGALCLNDRQGIISGTEGYIRVDNVNCPTQVDVYQNYVLNGTYRSAREMITGYEYQVIESKRCIEEGLLESPMMPHAETISIMKQMDELRKEWGVKYPMD